MKYEHKHKTCKPYVCTAQEQKDSYVPPRKLLRGTNAPAAHSVSKPLPIQQIIFNIISKLNYYRF